MRRPERVQAKCNVPNPCAKLLVVNFPEWRNWQTQQTQNLPGITPRVGSTPSSGTNISKQVVGLFAPPRPAAYLMVT